MIKRNLYYVYVEGTKDRKQFGYENRPTAEAALRYILQQLYETGKTVIFYGVREGERREYKA